MPLQSIKDYILLFNESALPPAKPVRERSPSNFRRSMSNSPNTNQQNQNNTNNPNNSNKTNATNPGSGQNSNSTKANNNNNNNNSINQNNINNNNNNNNNTSPTQSANIVKLNNIEQLGLIKAKLKEEPYAQRLVPATFFKKASPSGSEFVAKSTVDLTRTGDFAKLRYSALKSRNGTQISSLSLKPATVEGTYD